MMQALAAAAVGTMVAFSAPANAGTLSLAGDFGNPMFSYGTVDASNNYTAFSVSDCSDIGVSGLCYRGSDKYQVEFQRSAESVLIHPGPNDGQNSMLMFIAPRDGFYTFSATFERADSGDGVNLFSFGVDGLQQIGRLDAANPTYTYAGTQFFTRGQMVGLGVDRGGANSSYFNDSTLLSGTISGAVPEPATWAMMIGGIGMAGGAMRRRRQVNTTVRFA